MSGYPQVPQGYWSLFDHITTLLESSTSVVVSVDGRCGSGKTQLSQLIEQEFSCNVIHMDDFYLPFAQRTQERMANPGGHINYERLEEEILTPLLRGEPITLRPYDCHSDQMGVGQPLPQRQLTILEGSYSHHPQLRPFSHCTLFLTCRREVQEQRLLQRQGAEQLRGFIQRWMPLEEAYFAYYKIEEQADISLDTSDFF